MLSPMSSVGTIDAAGMLNDWNKNALIGAVNRSTVRNDPVARLNIARHQPKACARLSMASIAMIVQTAVTTAITASPMRTAVDAESPAPSPAESLKAIRATK